MYEKLGSTNNYKKLGSAKTYKRHALADARNEEKIQKHFLVRKKKWRKTVQNRALFLATDAMKEDNSDSENESEPENDENSCKICFEKYESEGDRQKAAIVACGHQFCCGCLSSLPRKSCPTCRTAFNKKRILKLFP
ncbi:unnamed protein product [Oikopleura dioica]|uniref:RING-type domain-containing protein n=1 Tax=Oikopleura dioica TaxID=34765 RepID=E4Y0A5_OIKDI|nr:unnamed protein product [Oikopleura dioica]